jgi:hypothetical protein
MMTTTAQRVLDFSQLISSLSSLKGKKKLGNNKPEASQQIGYDKVPAAA